MSDYWEEKYNDLKWSYNKLERLYDELKDDYKRKDDELYSAEFKIRTELEPRIKQEQRSYDAWVSSPGCGRCECDDIEICAKCDEDCDVKYELFPTCCECGSFIGTYYKATQKFVWNGDDYCEVCIRNIVKIQEKKKKKNIEKRRNKLWRKK